MWGKGNVFDLFHFQKFAFVRNILGSCVRRFPGGLLAFSMFACQV